MLKKVSIIIPALNEGEYIGKCLDSLCHLNCEGDEFEVILVDNGSEDDTCKIAESFLDKLHLKILVRKGGNISALRNFGVANAKGIILAFLDADCTVSPQWLNTAIGYFSDPEIAAVGSSHVTPDIASWVSKTWDAIISDKRKKGYVKKLPSGNLWVSCDKFIEIKGFNEELITNEDFDLCFRLLQKGYKIYSDPIITAWHWGVPRTVREFYRKNRWHGVHVFKVFLDNFPRLNNVKPIMFGLYYLVITMSVPVALIYFHLFIALLISTVTLLTPSLWLSWKVVRNKNESFTFFLKLFILYFVYGIARAHSILDSVVGFFRSRI